MSKLTPQQRLDVAVNKIMRNPRYVALAGILMIGKRTLDPDLPHLAATNGRDEWYNPQKIATLTDAELRFLILHEVYHKMYKHMHIYRDLNKVNPRTANCAMDYVINAQLKKDTSGFISMPHGGLYDPAFDGMDTRQMFHILMSQVQEQLASIDYHDHDGAAELSDEEIKELSRQIDTALRQGKLHQDALNKDHSKEGSNDTALNDLNHLLQPKVDWREVLRDVVTTQTRVGKDYASYNRPNRRYIAAGRYLPSGVAQSVDSIVVALDTSGSISRAELSQYLVELTTIVETIQPQTLHVMYWDTRVTQYELYAGADLNAETIKQQTEPKGGGGTDVTCIPTFIRNQQIKTDAVIILTDGYVGSWGDWSQLPQPIWCITSESITAPIGATIHVELD